MTQVPHLPAARRAFSRAALTLRTKTRNPALAVVFAAAFAAVLAGCASSIPPLPGPLEFPRSPKATTGLNTPAADGRPGAIQIAALPAQPEPQSTLSASLTPNPAAAPRVQAGAGEEVSMAIEQTPLPVFLQILYGNVLKRTYSLDPAVQARTDLVTFKTSVPIGRERMQAVAVNLLRSYGLTVQDFDGLVRILPEANAPVSPVLRRGRTLPETPESSRPIFQHVELEVARSTEVLQWMRQILGTRVTMQDDVGRNGILLSGTPADLRTALEMVQALDQPRMRGRIARRITPAYANVTDFSNRLVEMLGAQGYAASSTMSTTVPILILPIPAISSTVVFTNNEATMEHVLKWARELDRPVGGATSSGLYTYAVKYADAQDLAKTLGDLLSSSGTAPTPAAGAGAGAGAGGGTSRASGNSRVVVNNATNTLIFRGSTAEEYQQIQTLLRELDRPSKSALIEVVVAELRRSDAQSLGVQWDYNRYGVGGPTQNGAAGGGGFNFAITSNSLRLRNLITALASSNKARVLSNPKVMARNGESATIQVGQEVPIITSQQNAGTVSTGLFTSGPSLVQTVQYRSTGVILKVRPVINSGNRLDLDIQQEVSSAAATTTGVSSSPTISTRRVETKLSLRDGSTVLLAGLIDRKASGGNAGVPFLKDIPGLGALFRSENSSDEETELIVMITPYVINDDYEAEGISDAIQAGFGDWAQSIKPARLGLKLRDEVERNAAADGVASGGDSMPRPSVVEPAPSVVPAATPVAPAAAPPMSSNNKPAANLMEGITTTSEPKAAAGVGGKAATKAPVGKPAATVPAAPASAGTATSKTPPPANAPIKGGQVVEDEKIKQDVQKLFEGKR